MHRADEPTGAPLPASARAAQDGPSRNPISVAILAGLACMPIVVAAGFLTDSTGTGASVPADISAMALRGLLDGGSETQSARPARAGY